MLANYRILQWQERSKKSCLLCRDETDCWQPLEVGIAAHPQPGSPSIEVKNCYAVEEEEAPALKAGRLIATTQKKR